VIGPTDAAPTFALALYHHFEFKLNSMPSMMFGRSVPDFKAIAAFLNAAGSRLQAGSRSRDHNLCLGLFGRAVFKSRVQFAAPRGL